MENNIRFRNHISIILENSIKLIGSIFVVFVLNFLSDAKEMAGEGNWLAENAVMLVCVLIGGAVLILGWQALIWSKTYISIQDNTLIVERNTLNKNKNTIGLKNISNVNLEQNLLEMLLGTSKVKLDTNSLSTADETDVKIVLKTKDAKEFKQLVLRYAGAEEINTEGEGAIPESVRGNKHVAKMKDIVCHGLFSIKIINLLALVGLVALEMWMIIDAGTGSLGANIGEILINLFVLLWFVGGLAWNLVKEFVRYIGFNIERKQDKVLLNYGLLKKVAYSVPVDKINAVRITQTPIARIGKRYMVEIINVGMDDDENENNTFFLPYASKEEIKEQLHMLLPEFDGCFEIKEERQPGCVWLLWLPKVLIYLGISLFCYGVATRFEPELCVPILVGTGALGAGFVIVKYISFLTKGVAVHEKFLKIVNGSLVKSTLFVKYDKIQIVTGKQSIMAKHYGVEKGSIWLLASMKNRIHPLPYFKETELERLRSNLNI